MKLVIEAIINYVLFDSGIPIRFSLDIVFKEVNKGISFGSHAFGSSLNQG